MSNRKAYPSPANSCFFNIHCAQKPARLAMEFLMFQHIWHPSADPVAPFPRCFNWVSTSYLLTCNSRFTLYLVIYYSLFTMYFLLFTIYYLLFTIYYLLFTLYYLLFSIYCFLFTIYYLLFTIYWLLLTMYDVLFTIFYVPWTMYYWLCIFH